MGVKTIHGARRQRQPAFAFGESCGNPEPTLLIDRLFSQGRHAGDYCMLREPLLYPAAAMAMGVLSGHLRPEAGPAPMVSWIVAAVCVVIPILYVCARGSRQFGRWAVATGCLAAFFAGMATEKQHHLHVRPQLNADDGEILLLSGCVTNPPVFSAGREQFTLELTPKASARVTLNLRDTSNVPLRYGDRIEATATIRRPRNFGNPGAFDYAGYLAEQKIFWTASVSNPDDLHRISGQCGSSAIRALFDIRTWSLARLSALYPNDPHTAALLAATLLGETSGVEKRWTNDFRITGTYHALVISGQHVSVLATTLLLLLRLLNFKRLHALAIAVAACWIYAFISGFTAPVVRAAGAFSLFLLACYFFRRLRVFNVLAVVSILYLMVVPHQLFDASFQLSFLSAAAIAAFAIPLIESTTAPLRASVKRFDQQNYATQLDLKAAGWRVELHLLADTLRQWTGLTKHWTDRIVPPAVHTVTFAVEAVAVSACVQFGLALPMISYFHRLSITGLSANILVIPLLSAVVPMGFAAIATGWAPLAALTRWPLLWAEDIATWHAHFEPAYRMAALPLGIALGFVALLVLLACTARNARQFTIYPLAASVAFFLIICWQPWRPELKRGVLEVATVDVGQGDSVFLAFPDGTTMLVDAGGFPGFTNMKRKPQMDIGEDVVSPYLWSRYIKHLDYAVLTHGHSDHMGGLSAILDNFRPRALWIGAEPPSGEWNQLAARAKADGVQIVPLRRGAPETDFGGARVRVLSPTPDYFPGAAAHNNDSLVLEVTYGQHRVLLTGDAEAGVEAELVAQNQLRPVTLLKVGHHGSKTSSTDDFLTALQPRYAFISDGYKNSFHHPHPTVLARLADHHVQVFRTDEAGLSSFVTDGYRVQLTSYR